MITAPLIILLSTAYKCDFLFWKLNVKVQRASCVQITLQNSECLLWNYLNLSNLQFELAESWKPAFHVRFLALTFQVLARNIIFVVLQFQNLMAITIVIIKALSLLALELQKYLVAVCFWKCEKVEEKVFISFSFFFFPYSFCLFWISSSLCQIKCPSSETINFVQSHTSCASSKHQTYETTVTVVYFFVISSVCWKLKHFPHLDVWHIWLWKASPSGLGPIELSMECEHHCKKHPMFVLFRFRHKLTLQNLNTEHFAYLFI